MAIFHEFVKLENSAVALGNFDGVHIALQKGLRSAALAGANSVAVLLLPKVESELIESDKQADFHIKNCGINHIIRAKFETFCEMSPREFFCEVLLGLLDVKSISCGFDFRFGKKATGDIETLKMLCDEFKVELVVIEEQKFEGDKISSRRIRDALRNGDIDTVSALLGRAYAVDFEIKRGFGIGKTLGFPTVNQYFEEGFVLPKEGVYVTSIEVGGQKFPSATGVTKRPTFDGEGLSCETTSSQDLPELYGESVTVFFHKYLFAPRKFKSGEELAEMVKEAVREAVIFSEK